MIKTVITGFALVPLVAKIAMAMPYDPNAPSGGNFAGPYLGLFAGFDTSIDVTVIEGEPGYNGEGFGYSGAAFDVGVFGGYDVRFGSYVVGGELEVGVRHFEENAQFPPFVGVRAPEDSRSSFETDLLVSGSLRGGHVVNDDLLVYVKGGMFALWGEASFIDNDPAGLILVSGTSRSETLYGGLFGAGLEYQIAKDLSVRAETLYNVLIEDSIKVEAISNDAGDYSFEHKIDPFISFRLMLSYQF